MAKVQFLGAAGTVTGSKFLVEIGGIRFMVDCGMFQGAKRLRLQNWAPLPVAVDSIDMMLVTHAHIDHIGMLPVYVKKGFRGPVYMTPSSCELCEISLLDAAHLQEEDAKFANKKGFSKHSPALPLYTSEDAHRVLDHLHPLPYEQDLKLNGSVTARFRDAGHILGSAILEVRNGNGGKALHMVFSGDLGRYGALILNDPAPVNSADYLVVESTYGNRQHPPEQTTQAVCDIINETARQGGVLVVPAFALGRTQTLLYVIRDLKVRRLVPDLPVFVDSPMAIHVSDVFNRHLDELDQDARTVYQATGTSPILFPNLHYTLSKEQSQELNSIIHPAIIISASGMATGGRILHHLKHRLPDPRNSVLFIGFQSNGTRGQILRDGGKEIKIHGEMIPVRAKIHSMESFSGHADSNEIMRWLRTFRKPPKRTFIVHGEPDSSLALAEQIKSTLGWETHVPELFETVELT